MIKPASCHKDEILECIDKGKYPYYSAERDSDRVVLHDESPVFMQFISVDRYNPNLLGYIEFKYDEKTNSVEELTSITFDPESGTFRNDLAKIFKRLWKHWKCKSITAHILESDSKKSQYDEFFKSKEGECRKIKSVQDSSGNYQDVIQYKFIRDS